jgi:hypothetical protein
MCWMAMPVSQPIPAALPLIYSGPLSPNHSWFSTPLDDPVQAADDPFRQGEKVDLDAGPRG